MSDKSPAIRYYLLQGGTVATGTPPRVLGALARLSLSTERAGRIAAALNDAFALGAARERQPRWAIIDVVTRQVRVTASDFGGRDDAMLDERPRFGVCVVRTTEHGLASDETVVTAWSPSDADAVIGELRNAYADGVASRETG